jgi:hypothetical protein
VTAEAGEALDRLGLGGRGDAHQDWLVVTALVVPEPDEPEEPVLDEPLPVELVAGVDELVEPEPDAELAAEVPVELLDTVLAAALVAVTVAA